MNKRQRILVAGVRETFEPLSAILAGLSFDFVDTFRDPQLRLASLGYDVILIGAHFDESRMFDLFGYLKASAQHAQTPVICFRAIRGRGTRSNLTMRALGTSVRVMGAVGFVDLVDSSDRNAADAALRKLVDETLAKHPATTRTPQDDAVGTGDDPDGV